MKKIRKVIIFFIIFLTIMLLTNKKVYAYKLTDIIEPIEYTEEFKKYLKLSNKERSKVLQPRTFEVKKTKKKSKLLKSSKIVGSSLENKFTLQDVIPDNVVVRNQENTNSCWAFASIASLETNLALTGNDKSKKYDFSERHMNYSNIRLFKNNEINTTGFNRKAEDGGTIQMALAYLTNGSGAVNEEEMPFENNNDLIDINNIKNKKISSEVYDTVWFSSDESSDAKTQIKQHIKKYGSIAAQVYGAQLVNEYYNNKTAALYCDNKDKCPINHAVSIVGWDDNFSVDNFNEAHRPKNNGAWIVKNSWGTIYEEDADSLRRSLYNQIKEMYSSEELQERGITDYTKVNDEMVQYILNEMGYDIEIEDNKIKIKVGKDGFMYISYEDVNIYSFLMGISKATDKVNYENIYQYDTFSVNDAISLQAPKVYLANIFDKKTTGQEYLTQVSLFATETYTCKVYVNPNGPNTDKKSLQEVELKEGTSETFSTGYHTLEFAKPIEIKSDKFVVMIEIEGTDSNAVTIAVEKNIKNSVYDMVEIEEGKCLITTETSLNSNEWLKLSELKNANADLENSDSTIKAFTVSKVDDMLLNQQEEKKEIKNEESKGNDEITTKNIKLNNANSATLSKSSSSKKVKELPYTGTKTTLIIILGIFVTISVITYYQVKKYSKI